MIDGGSRIWPSFGPDVSRTVTNCRDLLRCFTTTNLRHEFLTNRQESLRTVTNSAPRCCDLLSAIANCYVLSRSIYIYILALYWPPKTTTNTLRMLPRSITNHYESTGINTNEHTPLLTPCSVANKAWFVAFVEDFLTVKNMLHELHECQEPTRSVENHIQMRYISLRMCHEWWEIALFNSFWLSRNILSCYMLLLHDAMINGFACIWFFFGFTLWISDMCFLIH